MAVPVRSTKQIADDTLTQLDTAIGQESPLADQAFNRVLSVTIAGNHTELYKFAIERALQSLALTATGQDLIDLGKNFGVFVKPAEAAVLDIDLPGADTTIISQGNEFVGDPNGIRYSTNAQGTISGGTVTLEVTAKTEGVDGNLNISDTLTISTQIAGAETTATVSAIINTGVEIEDEEDFRVRFLDKIQSQGGGGNAADYRTWSQEVSGVVRAYPYTGRPTSDPTPASPPDRTVYVEVATSIDPDGLAPPAILTDVRASITTDPETGNARQPLGLTDSTLFVVSIDRTAFYVEIRVMTVDIDIEPQVKTDISTELTKYFDSLRPFVDGLDTLNGRNNLITDLTVGAVVQDMIGAAGGSAEAVGFGLSPSSFLPEYRLGQGELAKFGGVVYI